MTVTEIRSMMFPNRIKAPLEKGAIMKQKSFAIGFLVFIFTCTACKTESDSSVEMASADPCDRVCLEGFVDLYLEALVEHDSSRLPLTQNARYTENGQALQMNDGMWQVATAVGDKKLYFADPVSGQVGFRGIVEENGHKQIIITQSHNAGRSRAV